MPKEEKKKKKCDVCYVKATHKGNDRLCSIHCEEKGHGHCAEICARKPKHGSDNYCVLHCQEKGHGHCIGYFCDKDTKGMICESHTCYFCKKITHRGGEFCGSHCTEEGHYHCKTFDCENWASVGDICTDCDDDEYHSKFDADD